MPEKKEIKCKHCNKDFYQKRPWQKYCSNTCKNHSHLHLEVGAMKWINCLQCGYYFKQVRRVQKFCCKSCRDTFNSQLYKKLKGEFYEKKI